MVLQAMQQQRQVAEGTTTGGGAPSLPAPLDVSQQGSTAAAVVPAVVSPSTAAGEAGRVGLIQLRQDPLYEGIGCW